MRRLKRAFRSSSRFLGWDSVKRAIVSFIAFLIAMWVIYYLLGIFLVVEEFLVGIAFAIAACVTFVPIFLYHLIVNPPTRSMKFDISTDPNTHQNLGKQGDGLPLIGDGLIWWRGRINLESKVPITVKDLQLKLRRKTYSAYDFERVDLNGAGDFHWRDYSFSIPDETDFGKQKAEIIAVTERDDYGSGAIVLRGCPITNSGADNKMLFSQKVWKQYILPAVFSIAFIFFSHFWENMLTNNISLTLGYILYMSSHSIVLGFWGWRLIGLMLKKHRFVNLIRIMSMCSLILIFVLTSPLYIDYFVKPKGNIEMPTFVDDSSQVLVHYGRRPNDFLWTQTTVGELKENPNATLKVNGQDILYIHTEENKLYVDAIVFAGYGNQIVIERTDNFSLQMSGYINTDNGSNKYFIRKSGALEVRVDAAISGKITASKIAQPVVIKNNALAQPVVIRNNAFSSKPNGWRIQQNNTTLEITNENNVPVLVLEYKSPYEITIAGLFATTFGVLKVDNSKDVIFEFGDSLSQLGNYKVDRIFVKSIFDLFRPERTYSLYDTYEGSR